MVPEAAAEDGCAYTSEWWTVLFNLYSALINTRKLSKS